MGLIESLIRMIKHVVMENKIYLLHEYGDKKHYKSLKYLCKNNGTKLFYREFSICKSIIKSILRGDIKLLKKQLLNIYFLISLLFTKDKKIVLGIAPYDFRLLILSVFLKSHKVYYHTSWTCWDGSFYPKKLLVNNGIIDFWKNFLKNKVTYIFAVSSETKKQLIKNLKINSNKINVVYHSFDKNIFKPKNNCLIGTNFIYVGRLEEEKGIEEILEYFSQHSEIKLTIIGKGKLKYLVEEYDKKYKNINYIGYVKDEKKLASLYQKHTFLILNSKKTKTWEELFGMVIIEAMACGVIPLTANHKGPLEIIENEKDGFIFEEDKYIDGLDFILKKLKTDKNYFIDVRNNAIIRAKNFTIESISKKWEKIFE